MKNMTYNSQKENLKISEYGRNVQNLINYAKTIEDKEKRQKLAERIVLLMYQMNPQNKNMNDYKAKLWSHMLRISEFELDVEIPEGLSISQEQEVKPHGLEYPKSVKRFRHYGRNIMDLIQKAISMEDGPKKDAFVEIIARYMKLAYRTWNREHYVSDEIIVEDLKQMSGGKLELAENFNLDIGPDPYQNRSGGRKKKNGGSNKYKNNRNKKRK